MPKNTQGILHKKAISLFFTSLLRAHISLRSFARRTVICVFSINKLYKLYRLCVHLLFSILFLRVWHTARTSLRAHMPRTLINRQTPVAQVNDFLFTSKNENAPQSNRECVRVTDAASREKRT